MEPIQRPHPAATLKLRRPGLRCAALFGLLVLGMATAAPTAEPLDRSAIDPIHQTITLDVQDAKLVNLLRLVADAADLNLIIDPSIDHEVTLKLEEVSLRQLLELLLRMYGLGSLEQGNVMWIAPADHPGLRPTPPRVRTEPLETRIVRVRYAKASDLKPILENAAMSDAGSVVVDERTNTLILRDHPDNLRSAIQIIGHP